LEKVPADRRRWVLVRELLLALVAIIVFIFCGQHVMNFLGLKAEPVTIAGSIILFLIALRMVFPVMDLQIEEELDGEPLLVPMAIPLIAGPSLMTVLMVFSTAEEGLLYLLLAALLAWAGTFIVLFSSTYLYNFLAKRGLIAIKRLMGMLLVALSVQMFLDGVSSYLGK
jgi:multiple antibiotic resistance protein